MFKTFSLNSYTPIVPIDPIASLNPPTFFRYIRYMEMVANKTVHWRDLWRPDFGFVYHWLGGSGEATTSLFHTLGLSLRSKKIILLMFIKYLRSNCL